MSTEQDVTEIVDLGAATIETKGVSAGAPEEIGNQPLGIDAE